MIMRPSCCILTAFLMMDGATRAVAFAPSLPLPQQQSSSSTVPTALKPSSFSGWTSHAASKPSPFLANHARPTTTLSAVTTEDYKTDLVPSGIFLLSAAALIKLFLEIQGSDLALTPGIWALLMTTLAVGYDNLIIGLGKPCFPNARTNQDQYDLLRHLSFPRFTAHAVFVPFLYATTAEIGQQCNVDWLQGESIQTIVLVAATVLGIASRVSFVQSSGIKLADVSEDEDVPENAWERQLIWFTYKDFSFLYILPAIVLALFNLVVGVEAFQGQEPVAAAWLVASAVAVLYGNAKPSYVSRFTGNLAEVVMLWCIYEAALTVAS